MAKNVQLVILVGIVLLLIGLVAAYRTQLTSSAYGPQSPGDYARDRAKEILSKRQGAKIAGEVYQIIDGKKSFVALALVDLYDLDAPIAISSSEQVVQTQSSGHNGGFGFFIKKKGSYSVSACKIVGYLRPTTDVSPDDFGGEYVWLEGEGSNVQVTQGNVDRGDTIKSDVRVSAQKGPQPRCP